MQVKNACAALIVAVCLIESCTAITEARWAVFKQKYAKLYSTAREEARHRLNWERNHMEIEKHNELFLAGKTSYYMEENKYSDMSKDEFRTNMLGAVVNAKPTLMTSGSGSSSSSGHSASSLPKTADWREKGYVTAVKDQGPCGSCWAFSTTGGLEAQHFRATGKLVSLSESNLIDCTRPWGNLGCHGGLMDNAYQYIIDNGGIDTETSYPYDPSDGHCFFTQRGIGATMKAYRDVTHFNETALQEAVAFVGPVSVAVNADDFHNYGGGVYNEPDCPTEKLDHAVLVVGYGHDTLSGLDYWIVKNSWGDSWGMKGYIWMARNKNNQCGIASMGMYPVV